MAVITKQELIDASVDATTLSQVMNGPLNINGTGIVTSRLGLTMKVLAKAIAELGAQIIGKDTKANLDADLAYSAGTVALVLNDSTAANNLFYRKTGSIGSGAWVIASDSFISQLLTKTAAIRADLGLNDTYGVYPSSAAPFATGAGLGVYQSTPVATAGILTSVSVAANIAASAKLLVVSLNGDGTLKLEASKDVTLVPGENTFDWGIAIAAGHYVGAYSAAATIGYVTGSTGFWYTTGVPGAATAKTTSSSNLQIGFKVETALYTRMRTVEGVSAGNLATIVGSESTQGNYPASNGSNTLTSGITIFSKTPAIKDGNVTEISVYTDAIDTGYLCIVSLNGDGTVKLVDSKFVAFASGLNSFTDWNPKILAGQFVAVRSDHVKYSGSGVGIWYTSGLPGQASAKTASDGITANIGWKIKDGLNQAVLSLNAQLASQFIDASIVQGTFPPVNGSLTYIPGTVFNLTPIAVNGLITDVSVYAAATASAKIVLAKFVSGSAVAQSTTDVTLASGVNTFTGLNIYAEAGWYLGIYTPVDSVRGNGSGNAAYFSAGLPNPGLPVALTAGDAKITWKIAVGLTSMIKAEAARAKAAETGIVTYQINGSTTTVGNNTTSSTYIVAGYTTINAIPSPIAGRLTTVSVRVGQAGSGILAIFSKSGSNVTMVASKNVTLVNGLNDISWGVDIAVGQYVGLYTVGDGIGYSGSSGDTVYYHAGVPGTSVAISNVNNAVSRIQYSVVLGLLPRIVALENNLTVAPSIGSAGYGLLDAADNTGVADATAVFTAARGLHPHPYVPVGVYAVTALPYGGDGFWGPGLVKVNGIIYPLPSQPRKAGGLLRTVRNKLATQIGNGYPIVFGGDSLVDHYSASVLAKSWVNLFEDWINQEYAPGSEPSTVVVRDDDGSTGETAAFFGLTLSGNTPGYRGPVGKSVIIASGGYIEFQGAYSTVEVFYQQESGAGSLTRSIATTQGGTQTTNGPVINAAGSTVLDKVTAFGATAQSASRWYRITASGGPVEITGLVRNAAKISTSGWPNPLQVMRWAYGGYSVESMTNTRIDSMLAQANNLAGTTVKGRLILALGTNDMLFGTAPRLTVFETDLTRIVTRVQAAGWDVDLITPARPDYASWGTYYTSPQNFDMFVGIQNRVGKALGCKVKNLDEIDFYGLGLMAGDKLHYNDDGGIKVFNEAVDLIAS